MLGNYGVIRSAIPQPASASSLSISREDRLGFVAIASGHGPGCPRAIVA